MRRRPVPGTPFSTTPVLRSQRQVISNGEIGAATLSEETLRVGVGSGYDPAPVASRVEHKSPAFRKEIGADFHSGWNRQIHNEAAGRLVDVGLHSGGR